VIRFDCISESGMLSSRLGPVTPERGGRAKRLFALRPAGLERLRSTRALFQSMSCGFEDLLDVEV